MNATACLTETGALEERGDTAMRKVWIEAALNGAWSRALQPGIPDTVEAIVAEGVACARAGAQPKVSGREATAALELALEITRQIEQNQATALP